jgi:hypothetical protein
MRGRIGEWRGGRPGADLAHGHDVDRQAAAADFEGDELTQTRTFQVNVTS